MSLQDLRRLLAAGALAMVLVTGARVFGASPPLVSASGAWIRWLPGSIPAAGYVTLQNGGDHAVTLVGASTRDYAAVMFHASRNQDGVERMLPIGTVRIEPHSHVTFAPQGLHMMLMQPARSIEPGDRVVLTLRFADGLSLPVEFEVRKPDGSR
jgi:hypothetical protein